MRHMMNECAYAAWVMQQGPAKGALTHRHITGLMLTHTWTPQRHATRTYRALLMKRHAQTVLKETSNVQESCFSHSLAFLVASFLNLYGLGCACTNVCHARAQTLPMGMLSHSLSTSEYSVFISQVAREFLLFVNGFVRIQVHQRRTGIAYGVDYAQIVCQDYGFASSLVIVGFSLFTGCKSIALGRSVLSSLNYGGRENTGTIAHLSAML